MLKTKFVPVAIDQAYQRRQKDTEGEFYRKIAGQGRRNDFTQTTQGHYVATADGKLLGYTNNRGADRVGKQLEQWLQDFQPEKVATIDRKTTDKRYSPKLPEGGFIVRTRAKIMSGYKPTDDKWRKIFQSAVSRDNLWITRDEHEAIAKQGVIPDTLKRRIARFHLVDNTRGEPPMWEKDEIQSIKMTLNGTTLIGEAELQTKDKSRTYKTSFRGIVETAGGKVTRFDLIAKGMFSGEGRYTKNAPKGEFPLVVSFELADGSDVADGVPPQGGRGHIEGYLQD